MPHVFLFQGIPAECAPIADRLKPTQSTKGGEGLFYVNYIELVSNCCSSGEVALSAICYQTN